jgi:hypothetical protein
VPDEKTPPTGTSVDARPPPEIPRPLPTIPGIYNLTAGLAGQMGGLRTDIDTLLTRTEAIEKMLVQRPISIAPPSVPPSSEVLLVPKLPSPASLAPPTPPPRPSMAAKAIKNTGWGALITSAVVGVLGVAVEIIRQQHPEIASLIGALAKAAVAAYQGGGVP